MTHKLDHPSRARRARKLARRPAGPREQAHKTRRVSYDHLTSLWGIGPLVDRTGIISWFPKRRPKAEE